MKKLVVGIFSFLMISNAYAYDWSWIYSSSQDEFSNEKTYIAYISEPIRVNFSEYVSEYDFEIFKFGLRCDISDSGKVDRLLTFEVGSALSYYNSPVRILIKVGETKRVFSGRMYRDSMKGGYTSLTSQEFSELSNILSKGQDVLYRVEPIGEGESDGARLTLRGSAKSLKQLSHYCDT
ncbi:hypothetical protein [Amphritea sp.]|uniref:hypothetical protein n=1 Tax=Amphritea sp. TaxID=1872502 RepID=UPI003A94D65B